MLEWVCVDAAIYYVRVVGGRGLGAVWKDVVWKEVVVIAIYG